MRKPRTTLVAIVLICAAASARAAASGVPGWAQTYAPAAPGTGNQDPVAVRALADESILVAAIDKYGVSAVRYGSAGAVLSTATVYPPFTVIRAAIGPFGEIVAVSQAPSHGGDYWTMKYDGLTGKAMWPAPAVFDGAGSSADLPEALALDGHGDVVVTGYSLNGTDYDWATLKLDGRSGARLWGPVIMNRSAGSSDIPAALALDAAGNIAVTGFSQTGSNPYDWVTAKYAGATGDVLWGPVAFDGPDHQSDFPRTVALDGAGNVFVTGETHRVNGDSDWATVKYDAASGVELWGPVIFGGAGGDDDIPATLSVDSNGDVVVSGRTWSGTTYDWVTFKYAGAAGGVLWGPVAFSLSSSSEDYPLTSGFDGAGNVVVAGYSFKGNDYDWTTMKYSGTAGGVLWGPKVFGGAAFGDDFTRGLAIDDQGNAVVAGVSFNGFDNDAVTVVYGAATGVPVWGPVAFNGAGNLGAFDSRVAVDYAGNVVVAGTQGGQFPSPADPDWFTLKYDGATGAILWGPILFNGASNGDDRVTALGLDASGNVVVTGTTSTGSNLDWATIRYDGATGAVAWGPVFFDGGGGSSVDQPQALAVDSAGDVVVTGYSYGGSLGGSPTIKYSGASGAVLWGPLVFDGVPTDVAVDGVGNAFVTGSMSNGSDNDWSTVKYRASDGAVLWGPVTYDGPVSGSSDTPKKLAVDGAGNIVVTGIESGPAGGVDFDWVTLKYDGAAGGVLWGPVTFGGDGGRRDEPVAISIDGSGNVFVTGTAVNVIPGAFAPAFGGFQANWATFKYDGSNGAVLWGPVEFDGALHLDDIPSALAVDSSGNAVVAGKSYGALATNDFVTMKYGASNGAELWRPVVFDGGGGDSPKGVRTLGADAIVTGVSGGATVTIRYTEGLGIRNLSLPPAYCGAAYAATLAAQNGAPSYSWSIVSGALPAGLSLNAANGQISGVPSFEGMASFRIRVTDAASAFAERDFSIDTFEGEASLDLMTTENPVCPGVAADLSVAETFDSYLWLPGGETTPSITVLPTEPTLYGLTVTDAAGCTRRGSILLAIALPAVPAPVITVARCPAADTPGLTASVAAHVCDSYVWALTGGTIDAGQGANAIAFTSGGAGTLMTLTVTETNSGVSAMASETLQVDFGDVAAGDLFHDFICTIGRNGVTAGCGGGNYCPTASVSRAQMAVFLLKSKFGSSHVPPPATGTVFADVPIGSFAADWIEELASLGVTGGCGGGNYCPGAPVTRAQMAVFLLKTLLGSAYVPPVVAQIFNDVPPGSFAADWINDLATRGITGGCGGGNYCPGSPNTRGQMAVFLTRTFDLM